MLCHRGRGGGETQEAGGQRGCTRAQLRTESSSSAWQRGSDGAGAGCRTGRPTPEGESRRVHPTLDATGPLRRREGSAGASHHVCPAQGHPAHKVTPTPDQLSAQLNGGCHPHFHTVTQVKTGRATRWHRETAHSNIHTGPRLLLLGLAGPLGPGRWLTVLFGASFAILSWEGSSLVTLPRSLPERRTCQTIPLSHGRPHTCVKAKPIHSNRIAANVTTKSVCARGVSGKTPVCCVRCTPGPVEGQGELRNCKKHCTFKNGYKCIRYLF